MGSKKELATSNSWFSTRYIGRWIMILLYILFGCILYRTMIRESSTAGSRVERSSKAEENSENRTNSKYQNNGKNVLIYAATQFFGEPITTERFLSHCPETQKWCQISRDDGDADKADGIVFHNADYHGGEKIDKIVKNRKPDVPLVLWSLESPSNDNFRPGNSSMFQATLTRNMKICQHLSNGFEKESIIVSKFEGKMIDVINWTMTYRTDADIWSPYGNLVRLEEPAEIGEELEELWKSKSKKVTWLASNCVTHNKRFDLVKKMTEKGLDIDIWGNCGKQPGACSGVSKQENSCVIDLLKPYKFYLSIENSNCKDYVTEKFWKALGERKAVPIVLSRKYYKPLGVPDSAYIAVEDFKNLDEFVAHIKKVGKDKDLYLKYHQWRKYNKVFIGGGFAGWCTLCSKLQDIEVVRKNLKNYHDVAWWHSYETCDNTLANPFLV